MPFVTSPFPAFFDNIDLVKIRTQILEVFTSYTPPSFGCGLRNKFTNQAGKKIANYLILPLSERLMLFVTSISLAFSHTYSMGNSTCEAILSEEVRISISALSQFPDYRSNKYIRIICQSRHSGIDPSSIAL